MNRMRYATQVLALYQQLPGTLGRVLEADRRMARALYDRRVSLETVENALLLARARRSFHTHSHSLEPIRSLRYFLPVIQELLEAPPDPHYLSYLRARLRHPDLYQPS